MERGQGDAGRRFPAATHGVDVTDTLARGVASLKAHEAYLNGLGQPMDPESSWSRSPG